MTNQTPRKPDYAAYVVRDREDKDASWREIGVAFNHRDGKGIDILLDAVPVGGRIVLRERFEEASRSDERAPEASNTPRRTPQGAGSAPSTRGSGSARGRER